MTLGAPREGHHLCANLHKMDPPLRLAPVAEEYTPGFIVSHHKLEFEIDFVTRSITGYSEITILPQRRDIKELRFHARQCDIHEDEVKVNGRSAETHYDDYYKRVAIPDYMKLGPQQHEVQKERVKPLLQSKPVPGEVIIYMPRSVPIKEVNPFSEKAPTPVRDRAIARAGSIVDGGTATTPILTSRTMEDQGTRYAPLVVTIPFTTKSFREGLFWVGLDDGDVRYPHMYSRHSNYRGVASCIFPCFDDPHMRCTWEIIIKCGRTLGDALRKLVVAKTNGVNGVSKERERGDKSKANGAKSDTEPSEFVVDISNDDSLLEMNVVCSGELLQESQDPTDGTKKIFSYMCDTQVSPQHIGFSCGPFEQVDLTEFREDEGNDKLGQKAVKVYGFCLPGRSNELRNTCETMAFAVDWFALNFGSYPFQDYKLCFVDDQFGDAVPLASLTLCSSKMLFPEDIIDPEVDVTRTLIHALASQWVGINVINNQRTDMWVIVGISYFITDMCMQKLCGNNDYRFRHKTNADKLVDLDFQRPSIWALGEVLHLGQFQVDFMVLKAPLVLFILDRRLHKLSGTTGIARVISRMCYLATTGELSDRTFTTEGFRRTCEKIGHYKLDAFFTQWVMGAGCPRFAVTQKFNKKKLAVEMTISQKQDTLPTQVKLEKSQFLREFKEEALGVYAGEVQPIFTGPMTIRIHESDGTPYEHIVEIREGVQKIEIPYHTKYKRLKRSRREKERQTAGPGTEVTAENHDDVLLYCLGDVLQSKQDIQEFELVEWDAEMEAKMEQESYEWIRMDADFEWICELNLNMPSYMYLSQLQQDRDVVAQQDSMLFLAKQPPHPLVSTILVRTLYDKRYFWGIREMACRYLADHAVEAHQWIGRKHLEKCFQRIFCYPGTTMPKANDFSNKTEYLMKLAIPKAMARVRNTEGKCPREARKFIFDLLKYNDNGNNEYSDYYYTSNLMTALANSLIPVKQKGDGIVYGAEEDEDELAAFRQAAVEEIERYRRMDEWILSYQNIYTRTALSCKKALMKAKIIPHNPAELFAYTHDGTMDLVRLEAFDGMTELGCLSNDNLLKYFISVMSTDASPFVRRKMYETFFLWLGAVALGEYSNTSSSPATPEQDMDGDTLIVEDVVSQEAKKALLARTTSIEGALKALREELKDNKVLQDAIWNAVKSNVITAAEQVDFLDVCFILYDPVESMRIVMKYPRYYKAKYLGKVRYDLRILLAYILTNIQGKMKFKATGRYRDKMIQPMIRPPPLPSPQKPPPPAPRPVISFPSQPRAAPRPSPTPPPARAPTPVRTQLPQLPVTLGPEVKSGSSAMRPPSTLKKSAPSEPLRQRPSKIVKLRVRPEKLSKWPRGRFGPKPPSSRNPLPSSKPAASPSFRPSGSGTPSHRSQSGRDSPALSTGSNRPRDNTPARSETSNSSNKVRMPLPSGRTPLPGSTPAISTPAQRSHLEHAAVARSETGTPGTDPARKPSLKIKLSFGKKPGSITPTPQTPKPQTPKPKVEKYD